METLALGFAMLLSGMAARWAYEYLRGRDRRRLNTGLNSGLHERLGIPTPVRLEPTRLKYIEFGAHGPLCLLSDIRRWQREVRRAKVAAWYWPEEDFGRCYDTVYKNVGRPMSVDSALEGLARAQAGGVWRHDELLTRDENVRQAAEDLASKNI